jgi:hypothetical protein
MVMEGSGGGGVFEAAGRREGWFRPPAEARLSWNRHPIPGIEPLEKAAKGSLPSGDGFGGLEPREA